MSIRRDYLVVGGIGAAGAATWYRSDLDYTIHAGLLVSSALLALLVMARYVAVAMNKGTGTIDQSLVVALMVVITTGTFDGSHYIIGRIATQLKWKRVAKKMAHSTLNQALGWAGVWKLRRVYGPEQLDERGVAWRAALVFVIRYLQIAKKMSFEANMLELGLGVTGFLVSVSYGLVLRIGVALVMGGWRWVQSRSSSRVKSE